MAREPSQKGTSFLPLVKSLKAHPDRHKVVPQHLWGYLSDHLVVSGWYPERDYFSLLEALVKTVDRKMVGNDVWRFFAKFSVQRDIAGSETVAGTPSGPKGVYRTFASSSVGNPEQLFQRVTRLWSQYHDTGSMLVHGGRVSTNTVVGQLTGFHIPIEGFVRLQGYYVEEYGSVVGVDLESKVTKSTARGDTHCEWEFALARTPACVAYVASLDAVP